MYVKHVLFFKSMHVKHQHNESALWSKTFLFLFSSWNLVDVSWGFFFNGVPLPCYWENSAHVCTRKALLYTLKENWKPRSGQNCVTRFSTYRLFFFKTMFFFWHPHIFLSSFLPEEFHRQGIQKKTKISRYSGPMSGSKPYVKVLKIIVKSNTAMPV